MPPPAPSVPASATHTFARQMKPGSQAGGPARPSSEHAIGSGAPPTSKLQPVSQGNIHVTRRRAAIQK
jgi:hypothetical protein